MAWLARRPGLRRKAILTSAAVATVMGVVAIVVGFFYNVVLRFLWTAVSTLEWQPAAEFWQSHPLVGAAATFVAWDLTGWLYHVIGHRTRIGWAAHRPHHSGTEYDSTLGLRQTWAPFHGLVIHPLLALWGFDLETVVVCAAISNSWQILEHTSVPLRFPRWFAAVVMTPDAHRHHHGLEGGLVNLGPFFTWWDRLSGTWVPAEAPSPEFYGLATSPTNNPVRIELEGWLELVSGPRERSRRRAGAPGYV